MTTRPRRTLIAACISSSLLAACYSITIGPAGYERSGVWLAPYRTSDWEPSERIVVGELEMVFDSQLRVYRIADHPGHFYIGIRYYRDTGDGWEAAPSFGGPWSEIPPAQVPPGLRISTST